MGVVKKLKESAKREEGGAVLTERLDYQFAWGIQRILDVHVAERSYAFLFESHDDILELDHEVTPSKVVFYQVKTRKSGNWTISRFTERKKSKDSDALGSSIAGKMFDNIRRFSTCIERAVMVTNMPMPKLSSEVGEYCLTTLDKEAQKEFGTAMNAEDAAFVMATHLPYYHLNYSPLHFDNAHHTVVGQVADVLFKRTGSERGAKTFFDALSGECRRKAKPQPAVRTLAEFDAAHVLKRSDVESFLDVHGEQTVPSWANVAPFLQPMGFVRVTSIMKAWERYCVERRIRWETVRHVAPKIAAAIEPIFNGRHDFTIALEEAVAEVRDVVLAWSPTADEAKEFNKRQHREQRERFYAEKMRNYIEKLNVLNPDYDAISKITGRIIETGSEQPRLLLAYELALLATIQEFSTAFSAPMVIDSPNQQDQDDANARSMLSLIIDSRHPKGQTILGTVSMHGIDPGDASVIEFDQKRSVLRIEEFEGVSSSLRPVLETL